MKNQIIDAAITIIIVCAVAAIVIWVLGLMGIFVPTYVIGIVLAVAVAIYALRFLKGIDTSQ